MGGETVTSWRLDCWNREVGKAFFGFVEPQVTTHCSDSCDSAAVAVCRAGSFAFGRSAGSFRNGWLIDGFS